MKKLFFIAAIAGAALVGCTKNELAPSVTEQQEITFATPVVGTPTKVDLVSIYPDTQPFGVFALYYTANFNGFASGVNYMNNVKVANVAPAGEDPDGGWTAAGYYWPKTSGSTLTFAAYSPYMSTGVSHSATGITFEDYTVDASANVDLLFSDRAYNKTKADQIGDTELNDQYYGVDIVFNHALSAILFQAKAADKLVGHTDGTPNYEFVVTKIEVLNADNTGTFSQKLVDATDGSTPATPVASTTDWSTSGDVDYTAYSGAGITVNSTTTVSAYADPTGKADLILLPQSLADVKVKVTYNLRHSNMEAGRYITGNVAEANLSYEHPTDDTKDVTSWLRGKRYIYTLTLDLDQIYFSPEMTGWDDVTVAGSQIL
ncbi:MAG: fimbrillin family protein [Bacteroidales bacterium]|nr:fimbrillin family protein [Bacteroidales bacterium]